MTAIVRENRALRREALSGLVPDLIRRLHLRPPRRIEERRPPAPWFVDMVDRTRPAHEGPLHLRAGQHVPGLDLSYVFGGWFRDRAPIEQLHDAYSSVVRLRVRGDGAATAEARPLRDPLREAERKEGRLLRNGLLTSAHGRSGWMLGPDRSSVHHVERWGARLILTGPRRWRVLDADTLVEQDEDLTGTIWPDRPDRAMDAHHPWVDPETGRLVGFSFVMGPALTTRFRFFEVEPAGGARTAPYTLPGYVTHHAFGVTPRWLVLPELPLRVAAGRQLFGQARGAMDGLRGDDGRGLVVHLVPRPGEPASPQVVRFGLPGYVYHLLRAFEVGGEVVFDAFVSSNPPARELSQFELSPSRSSWDQLGAVVRFIVDPSSGTCRRQLLLPGVHRVGHATSHADRLWFIENDPHESLSATLWSVRGDDHLARWRTPEPVLLRQPHPIPKPGHRGAWVVVPAFTPDETQLWIFDGEAVSAGPVARYGAGVVLPFGNHGTAWAAREHGP